MKLHIVKINGKFRIHQVGTGNFQRGPFGKIVEYETEAEAQAGMHALRAVANDLMKADRIKSEMLQGLDEQ